MRIIIENRNGIEGFSGVYIDVPDWFALQENMKKHEASIIKQTEKAIMLDDGYKEQWIPRSLITIHKKQKGLENWQ